MQKHSYPLPHILATGKNVALAHSTPLHGDTLWILPHRNWISAASLDLLSQVTSNLWFWKWTVLNTAGYYLQESKQQRSAPMRHCVTEWKQACLIYSIKRPLSGAPRRNSERCAEWLQLAIYLLVTSDRLALIASLTRPKQSNVAEDMESRANKAN